MAKTERDRCGGTKKGPRALPRTSGVVTEGRHYISALRSPRYSLACSVGLAYGVRPSPRHRLCHVCGRSRLPGHHRPVRVRHNCSPFVPATHDEPRSDRRSSLKAEWRIETGITRSSFVWLSLPWPSSHVKHQRTTAGACLLLGLCLARCR